MLQLVNPEQLTPGDLVDTPDGPAEFIQYKPGNFRKQNVNVMFRGSGRKHWYALLQIQQRPAKLREPRKIAVAPEPVTIPKKTGRPKKVSIKEFYKTL